MKAYYKGNVEIIFWLPWQQRHLSYHGNSDPYITYFSTTKYGKQHMQDFSTTKYGKQHMQEQKRQVDNAVAVGQLGGTEMKWRWGLGNR